MDAVQPPDPNGRQKGCNIAAYSRGIAPLTLYAGASVA